VILDALIQIVFFIKDTSKDESSFT